MKYKTFRALVVTGGLALFFGTLHLAGAGDPAPEAASYAEPVPATAAAPVAAEPQAPIAPVAPATPEGAVAPVADAPVADAPLPPGAIALRPMDLEILAAVAGFSGDKGKDAVRGRSWKVNLYRDDGHAAVNRLRIDLDRDEKWDEKWSFLPEGLKRQVAPNDDEVYTEEFWHHPPIAAWAREKPSAVAPLPTPASSVAPAAPAPVAAPAASPAGEPLRAMDREILAAAKGFSGGKGKDAVRGRSWKVNLYCDAGHATANRLKIDLNRDDKWDEKWTLKPDGVEREVAPADDERYTVKYLLPAGAEAWIRR